MRASTNDRELFVGCCDSADAAALRRVVRDGAIGRRQPGWDALALAGGINFAEGVSSRALIHDLKDSGREGAGFRLVSRGRVTKVCYTHCWCRRRPTST